MEPFSARVVNEGPPKGAATTRTSLSDTVLRRAPSLLVVGLAADDGPRPIHLFGENEPGQLV